jgi:hypothetical protein
LCKIPSCNSLKICYNNNCERERGQTGTARADPKKSEKNLKNLLTSSTECGTIRTYQGRGQREPSQKKLKKVEKKA